ncbi:rhodanese-like domain-containing protein [Mesohalobacter halotolerans]|uniref:Rhodanese-like domain-containing protein n=1 Tax=Mesohalobacter halotolerans TaxID=1883405 RepID=A0A4U5TPV5_9FLAO|nr:rhodanese-like domain-containing protein [Mesohalobacter halotolerans]MBS3737925.1 rhodanese-like domain-containing protein [Psychroflexus sp.]TKS56177.1 rhodanese-like domain-containing protein [Mesohalobacter halotolerans]
MKHFKFILILILLLSIGCKEKAKYTNITMIGGEEMKTLLKNEEVQLVDVRTVKEFNENYIEGAENIVFDDNFDQKLKGLQKDKPVIVYCRSGRRSAKCADILAEKGFKKIYDLKGGITQWKKEGNKIKN